MFMGHEKAIISEMPFSMLIFLLGTKFLLLSSSYSKKISTYSTPLKHFFLDFWLFIFLWYFLVISNF